MLGELDALVAVIRAGLGAGDTPPAPLETSLLHDEVLDRLEPLTVDADYGRALVLLRALRRQPAGRPVR